MKAVCHIDHEQPRSLPSVLLPRRCADQRGGSTVNQKQSPQPRDPHVDLSEVPSDDAPSMQEALHVLVCEDLELLRETLPTRSEAFLFPWRFQYEPKCSYVSDSLFGLWVWVDQWKISKSTTMSEFPRRPTRGNRVGMRIHRPISTGSVACERFGVCMHDLSIGYSCGFIVFGSSFRSR